MVKGGMETGDVVGERGRIPRRLAGLVGRNDTPVGKGNNLGPPGLSAKDGRVEGVILFERSADMRHMSATLDVLLTEKKQGQIGPD